jgi:hypothetical protein
MKTVENLDIRPAYHARPVPLWRRVIALTLKTLVPLAILAVAAKISWALFLSSRSGPRPRAP